MPEYVVAEKTVHVCVSQKSGETRGKEEENPEPEEFVEPVGAGYDSEDARDKWIDEVEKLLEYEAFERGEIHMYRKFDEVMSDGDYGLDQPPRWMLA